MKIKQDQFFKPITITLETRDEAEAFIAMIERLDNKRSEKLRIEISNWFCEKAL